MTTRPKKLTGNSSQRNEPEPAFEAGSGSFGIRVGGAVGSTMRANGIATEIDVPAGYYDVFSTFTFKAS